MVKKLIRATSWIAAFCVFAYLFGNKSSGTRISVSEHDAEPKTDHLHATNEDLNRIEFIADIVKDKNENQPCVFYHTDAQKCALCGFLDRNELVIDEQKYCHSYHTENKRKYHVIVKQAQSKE